MRGYAGKFIDINLTNQTIKDYKFSEEDLQNYVGGRGLSVKLLWDRLGEHWDEVDPLSPENILTFFTGPLTGYWPGARLCISGKSPQSMGIVGSTIGCELPIELKCAGIDGVIVSGRSEKPIYLWVTDDKVEICDAKHLWGMKGIDFLKTISKEGREILKKDYQNKREVKEPQSVYIGPAGENQVRAAAVIGKLSHGAGYGGYGAVMGSKNLKALVVKGHGPLPEPYDFEKTLHLIKELTNNILASDFRRRWGTSWFSYHAGNTLSAEPVRNWQEEWHDEKTQGCQWYEQRVWVKRYWADFGCPTGCMKLSTPKIGKYIGALTDNPDYELMAYEGTNLGIFTPEENVYLSSLVDDNGLCGIQGGNILGFTAELFQRGIITREELSFELKWGDADAFAKLIELIVTRKGLGNILAEGTHFASEILGKQKGLDLSLYNITTKGIALGAHGIRSGLDYPHAISYALSSQGGDHTSCAYLPIDHPTSELTVLLNDSGVHCNFNTYPTGTRSKLFEFYTAVRGWPMEKETWYNTDAKRIINIQRAALLLGGPEVKWRSKIDDINPKRFYEPLPNGPYKGKTKTVEEVDAYIQEYYSAMNWDQNGIPLSQELQRLKLDSVDKKIGKYR
ncbi:aldehyde ferredoxin oxidoreductase [Candidatus Bathyarchaeota archaeon]|nr:aldehyde ferredoxin oxidoreductase [Candidatus Bathyarchaeota archaeon]